MKVAVLGADSFTGSAFCDFVSTTSLSELSRWTFDKPAIRDDCFCCYHGMDQLEATVRDADVVVNLHEAQDFSAKPDEASLRLHNVNVVLRLLRLHDSSPLHNWRLIHLSSPFLQCSSRWPNIFGGEADAAFFMKEWPYKAYCHSKHEAETLISNSFVDSFILRPVPVYGAGDTSSVICDLIKAGPATIPRIGDYDGVLQMMHIDNLTAAIWASVENLYEMDRKDSIQGDYSLVSSTSSNASLHCESSAGDSPTVAERSWVSVRSDKNYDPRILETMLLADDMEKKNVFRCYGQLLESDGRSLARFSIPLLPLYFLYCFFIFFLRIVDKAIRLPVLEKLPDPDFLCFNFHHWTFFNTKKSRFLLEHRPPCSPQASIKRSQRHYHEIDTEEILFSWQNSRPTTARRHK